jgi:Zn-finger nucleic acid-binding protein
MKCPRDGTALSRVQLLGLELDKCHKCDGIWFDRGELERIRDAQVEGAEELLEKKYGDPTFEEGAVEAHMRCPRCGDARLRRQSYTYDRPVKIDRCERCQGVWLDDSELDTIIGEKKQLEQEGGLFKSFLRAVGRHTKPKKG